MAHEVSAPSHPTGHIPYVFRVFISTACLGVVQMTSACWELDLLAPRLLLLQLDSTVYRKRQAQSRAVKIA